MINNRKNTARSDQTYEDIAREIRNAYQKTSENSFYQSVQQRLVPLKFDMDDDTAAINICTVDETARAVVDIHF